ncbi:hypothetical protein BDN72DRAFT_846441 [Pluteus cervinus]|uniref:Uncharacterized protein n=1 Tax=Pluteus cervinus TaxID=181527 RepID=A0ACD3AGA2_9AGAR|nr:hypothetical protein BDN72DRAFT_846441 [Pluteus cervinus]
MEGRTPILLHDLPPELTIRIFQHTVLSTKADSQILTTIKLSWVSKLWRNIVLGLPELWASFRCSYRQPSLIELCIERARTRPLSISLHTSLYDLTSLSIVAREIHRLKSFNLYYDGDRQQDEPWPGDWSVPAPQLETLHVDNFCMPNNFFNGQMPLLQSLTLSSCSFDWGNFYHLPQLLHLSLHRPCVEWPLSTRAFLEMLKRCPNLKSLKASCALEGRYGSKDIVNLQDLEDLSITVDHCHDATRFLRHLTFPHTTRVQLYALHSETQDPEGIFGALRESRVDSVWNAQAITMVEGTSLFYFKFTLFEHGYNPATPTIDISLASDSDDFIPFPIPLSEYMNLSELECLDFDSREAEPPYIWSIFDQLPKLRTLKVRTSYARQFLEFVQSEGDNGGNGSIPPFPHLQELVYESRSEVSAEDFNSQLLQLSEYLQYRRRIGFGVICLTVVKCDQLTKETKNALLECVQDLKLERRVPDIVKRTTSSSRRARVIREVLRKIKLSY